MLSNQRRQEIMQKVAQIKAAESNSFGYPLPSRSSNYGQTPPGGPAPGPAPVAPPSFASSASAKQPVGAISKAMSASGVGGYADLAAKRPSGVVQAPKGIAAGDVR